jgi:hypothetical protein
VLGLATRRPEPHTCITGQSSGPVQGREKTFVVEVIKGTESPLAGLTLSLTLVEVNTFFIGCENNYPHIRKESVRLMLPMI